VHRTHTTRCTITNPPAEALLTVQTGERVAAPGEPTHTIMRNSGLVTSVLCCYVTHCLSKDRKSQSRHCHTFVLGRIWEILCSRPRKFLGFSRSLQQNCWAFMFNTQRPVSCTSVRIKNATSHWPTDPQKCFNLRTCETAATETKKHVLQSRFVGVIEKPINNVFSPPRILVFR
jgi:hypothetical protein